MGRIVLGKCSYCSRIIYKDPLIVEPQYCDQCQTHMDLLAAADEIMRAKRFNLSADFYNWDRLEQAINNFIS